MKIVFLWLMLCVQCSAVAAGDYEVLLEKLLNQLEDEEYKKTNLNDKRVDKKESSNYRNHKRNEIVDNETPDKAPNADQMRIEENGSERRPMVENANPDPLQKAMGFTDDEIMSSPKQTRRKRNLLHLQALWPKSKVPYKIDIAKFDKQSYIDAIENSINIVSNLTCVQFLPVSNALSEEVGHNNSVLFTSLNGCTSHVGMVGPGQSLSITPPGCIYTFVILHEMLHAVGLMHEHLRSDRDNYIRMVGDGLSEKSTDTINYSPYDLQSTMQYSLLNHATYETVMEAIDRNQEFLVSARKPDTLQFYDIMELIKMYNCAGHCVNPPVCIHGGFVNHKCVCYCPDHTSGDRCEVIETDSGCGGVIDVDVGQEKSIVSPNYPNNYNANQTCRWLFTGRPGYNLRITIDEMHLPYNVLDQCHHWLEIQYNNPGHPGILRCGEASGLTYTTSRDSPEILIVTLDSKQNPTKSTEKGVAFRVFLVGQYCLDNPCQYGICKENDQGYYCECESGFSGQHCDQVQASQSLSCDFDLEQSCFLGNTPNGDKFDWTIKKYTANYMDTGPKHAHSGHGFLLADMTPPQEKGDVTHLVSKIQFPEEDRCLSFYYNMHGSYVESLTVKTASGDGPQNPVWSASGNKGLSWHKAQIDIPASYDLKIIFEAVCGLNYSSAIALDTITLAPGNCDLANQEEGVVQLKTYSNNILLDLADYGFTFAGIGWINFAVQCCNTVTVKFKTAVTDDYYKLILGDSGNRWSHVRKYQNGQQTAYTYAVGKFLDCDENKKVWIGWKDDKLQVGTGLVYGENVLMTVPDDAPLDVQSVVISSGSTAHWEFVKGNCVSGFWKCSDTGYCVIPDERCNGVPNCSDDEQGCVFPECSENEFRCTYGRCYPKSVQCDGKMDCTDESDEKDCPIHIPPYNTVSTSSLGVSVQGKSAFKFTVKSCTDVWVKLWVNQAEIYSLGLGRGNNVFSSLHKTDGSSLSYYGEVLDCDRYLPFYVSWAGTHVTAGRGHTLDQDVMLQLEDASIPSIDEIKIGSYSKDVYFNLEAALPGCDSATEFRCEFGRCIPIADRCDGAPHCTDGTDEMDCPIQVPAWEHTFISQHGYNISGHEWLNFKAKGCSNAFVELYSKNDRIYYVLLGRGQNEYSTLHNQLDAGTSKYKKLQVLDCNAYKDFWFSWKGDMVQVGQGLILGENIMFEFADSSLHLIDDVKLATWSDDIAYQIRQGNCFDGLFQCSESVICIPFEQRCNGQSNCAVSDGSDEENCDYPACDAETEFRCGYGRCYPKDVRCNEVMECSDGTDEHGCPIHTKPHQRKNIADYGYVLGSQTWINFKAKTCEEIQIRLYKNSQVIYKILLGRGRNSWSSLQVVGHKFTWKSGSIMKCDEYLPFWISWSNGDIKIGKGLNRHEDTYMSLSNQYSVGIDQMYIKSYRDDVFWFFEEGNCFPGLFQCTEEKECIPVKEICDGVSACAASGGSDEENCGPCSNDEFQCAFGLCIPSDKRCNGEDDCWDTSDEKNCPITVPVLHVTSYMDLGQYGINGAGRDTLIFSADACEDIWIGLMPDKSDTSVMYSIGIGRGGDTFNTVYKNGLTVKSTYTSELGCTTKELWLTWKNGKIAVGRGRDVTGPAFLEWTDTDPLEVNDIGLSSWNKAWIFQNIDV